MASMKRELPEVYGFQLKKARTEEWDPSSSSGVGSSSRVVLNPADCDIDFNVDEDGLLGSSLYERDFAYCWSGARANIGIRRGKYCFGCKILYAQPVHMEDTPRDLQNVSCVGISRGDDDVRNLGETPSSFGFGGTGTFCNSGHSFNYGERFEVGDTIICAVDLQSFPVASVSFSKNGNWLGVAKYFDGGPNALGVMESPVRSLHWESALFPHVLLKNVVVQMQFSIGDGLIPVEGYKPWDTAILDGNTILGPTFSKLENCEVLMMVGLPASGKTTWAENWVKANPEKRYVLLGTDLALDQMKVPALLRNHIYDERCKPLRERAMKIFTGLLMRASKIPRNFIIDHANVYKNVRKRKLKPFADFLKIAAVVFPRVEELKIRSDKRAKETGKEVPTEEVNELLGTYTLPMSKDMYMTDEYFDLVWFLELGGEESQRVLDEMKIALSEKLSSTPHAKGKSSLTSESSSPSQLNDKAPLFIPVQSHSEMSFENPSNLSGSGAGYGFQGYGNYYSASHYEMDNGNYYGSVCESNLGTSSSSYNNGDASHVPYGSFGGHLMWRPLGSLSQAGVYPQSLDLVSENLPMSIDGSGGFPEHFGVQTPVEFPVDGQYSGYYAPGPHRY